MSNRRSETYDLAAIDPQTIGVVNTRWRDFLGITASLACAVHCAAMPVGVKALNASPRKSGKQGQGERQSSLAFAGVTIQPGNYVYADHDGILVASRNLLAT